jgi:hypothetical protein
MPPRKTIRSKEEPRIITLDKSNLIPMDRHQKVAFWSNQRTLFLLWRRQAGKSYTLASWALRRMMEIPGHVVILCSASLALGKEWTLKEALVYQRSTQALRDMLAKQDSPLLIKTSADDDNGQLLDVDAIADLFEHQRLETKIYHSNTVYSRSMVVAPNPDTAVGWTGDVGLDEVGRIDCLRELLEAIGPVMTRNPDFMMRMATTISPDDTHFSREIHGVPANQGEFPVNPEGNIYLSKSGYTVHRFDAYDGLAAGLKLYDDKTGKEMTPDEHRAAALDKAAEDRNYFLKETVGGTAAFPPGVITRCIFQGRGECLGADVTDTFGLDDIPSIFPPDWQDLMEPNAKRLGLGLDVATTTSKKSNPSALTLIQQAGLMNFARLILRFKSADPAIARAIIDYLLATMPHGLKIRSLCIDASNERFFAVDTRKYFRGRLPVKLIVSGETLEYGGETITFKSYLGNQLINTAASGYLGLPACDWVEKDWQLVKTDKGMFYAEIDERGNHADTFDGTKLALHAVECGGPAKAEAAATASSAGVKPARGGIRSPYAPENLARRNPPTTTLHV